MATWLLVSILREAIVFANAALVSSIHAKNLSRVGPFPPS